MSSYPTNTTPAPVNADDIARRSYEQRFLIEDRVIASLVDIINHGIRDQVAHGLLTYEFCVPSFVYGFPRFDVDYVANRLRDMYANKGFEVTGEGCRAILTWSQKPRAPPSRTKPAATAAKKPTGPPPPAKKTKSLALLLDS